MRKEEEKKREEENRQDSSEEKEPEVEVDLLKWLYYENKNILQRESEALENDITLEVYTYIEDKIKNRELINMAFKGEVSGSKSTSAIALMNHANKIIEKHWKKEVDRFKHLFADQTEFLRFINSEETNVAIVIDEFSRVAETGLNSSTEAVLFDYYSDVFAQKFVHRFSCSPSSVMDRNATVILEYIGKDERVKISKFKVSYRNPAEGFREVTLGYVNIDVSKIIDEEFYKKYRKKKFERMSLLDKYGVRDIRELEFAGIVLRVLSELYELTQDGSKVSQDTVLATVSRICREEKRIYSLLTTSEISSRCKNLLNYHTEINRAKIRAYKCKNDEEAEIIRRKIEKYAEMMSKDYEEENKRARIYKEYLNIK